MSVWHETVSAEEARREGIDLAEALRDYVVELERSAFRRRLRHAASAALEQLRRSLRQPGDAWGKW